MNEIHVPVTWDRGIHICNMAASGGAGGSDTVHNPGSLERRWIEQLHTGETKLTFVEWLRRERSQG